MRFILYSEKTVAQCLSALTERMQQKGTSSRPELAGWIDKNGEFSLGVESQVAGRFNRTTYLRGKIVREEGTTEIHGVVANGATRDNMIVIFGVLALMAVWLISRGSIGLGLIILPVGAAFYIPLTGDHLNSEILLDELKKTLKAKSTPPKPGVKATGTGETRRVPTTETRRATGTTRKSPASGD